MNEFVITGLQARQLDECNLVKLLKYKLKCSGASNVKGGYIEYEYKYYLDVVIYRIKINSASWTGR